MNARGHFPTEQAALKCLYLAIMSLDPAEDGPGRRPRWAPWWSWWLCCPITQLSRYETASGSFQVVVALTTHATFMPAFIQGSQTLFIGQGTETVTFGAA